MEREEILSQINKIFTAILRKEIVLNYETTAKDVPGWDSLTNMMLIDGIEKQFSFKFKLSEVRKLNNVGDLVDIVKIKTTR